MTGPTDDLVAIAHDGGVTSPTTSARTDTMTSKGGSGALRIHQPPNLPAGPWRVIFRRAKLLLVVFDGLAILTGMLVATYVSDVPDAPTRKIDVAVLVPIVLVVHLVVFARNRLYLSRFITRGFDELRRALRSIVTAHVSVMAALFMFDEDAPRRWLVWSTVFVSVFVMSERWAVRECLRRLRRAGWLMRAVIVVGDNAEGRELCSMMQGVPELGYRVVGVIADSADRLAGAIGTVEATLEAVQICGATGVVIATSALDLAATNRLVRELTDMGIHVELSSSLRDIASNRLTVRPLGRFPVAYVEPVKRSGWRRKAKRAFDLVLAGGGLVIAAPLLVIAAIAVKVDSPGPVLFRQLRVGRDGRYFPLIKLRTMVVDAERRLSEVEHLNEAEWPLFKVRLDPRVTRTGRLLRKSSIDELPQLLNVLMGHMSIVGPRPALPREAIEWSDELRARLRVAPGITGMWQVSGRANATFEDYERLDLYYVDNWSLVTDLVIVARTVPAILKGRGAH